MALQSLAPFIFPSIAYINSAGSTSVLIDATGEKVAFIFQAPKTGNISGFHFRLATVTTGQTLLGSLQNVDLATGDPDGTQDQTGTVAVADGDDNTWKVITFGSSRAVTRGELLSVVIEFNASIGNLNVVAENQLFSALQYADHFTSVWTKLARSPLVAFVYDDASIAWTPGCTPGLGATVDYGSASTPDEYALKFQLPFPTKIGGAAWQSRMNGADHDVILYAADGSTPLATASWDGTVAQTTTGNANLIIFPAEVSLSANTTYYLALKPTTATTLRLVYFDVPSAAAMAAAEGGANLYVSTRTNAGAWTDLTTRRPMIGMILTAFDDGAGGGGAIYHGAMAGGML